MAAVRLGRHSSSVRTWPLAPGISSDQAMNHSLSRPIAAVNSLRMVRVEIRRILDGRSPGQELALPANRMF